MNVENILKVADAIEQHSIPDLGFNMYDYAINLASYGEGIADNSGHNCGTTACIAGWAVAVRDNTSEIERSDFFDEARDYLELTERQAHSLFLGNMSPKTTPAQAVKVMRNLAETGVIDWDKV